MRREPSLTLRGALAILGHYEPRVIEKLDMLLGGVILAAGAGAGVAAVGSPALAPLAVLAAGWGWLEQKNEALGLLRQAINSISNKLMGTRAYERRQLIAAAHTTIVIAAFFESFREHIGKTSYDSLRITESKKKALVGDSLASDGLRRPMDSFFNVLYSEEIPAPSSTHGYEDNLVAIGIWLRSLADNLKRFLIAEDVLGESQIEWDLIITRTLERYQSHYLALAAAVPEFMMWAMLVEHTAAGSLIKDLRSDMAEAFDANRAALGRVEALLTLQNRNANDIPDLCSTVNRANLGVLYQPIVPTDAERYGVAVEFPTVGSSYINPRYRGAVATEHARPTDENWWDQRPSRDDLDLALAAYITMPHATRVPLLLLGHPGAGKSLFTKVFAARLPASTHTVVRVPLRQVGANAPIPDQIQQALNLSTHGRVDWWRLVGQSEETVRVVLLDGLDELLQATSNDRSGYLQEAMEFQRREAEQEQPVVVLVTSRTVVADRVDIPAGAAIIKLDYFNEKDIKEWLHHWHAANASSLASGTVRGLTLDAALQRPDLARQPLLLLMLALYSADPASPALGAEFSTASLYCRLLDNFARREVAKKADHTLTDDEIDRLARDQLERLAIAAFAMFNRARQDIAETELGSDLLALGQVITSQSSPSELGQRLLAEFFFVHAAEAQPLSMRDQSYDAITEGTRQKVPTRRCYEFLHATFGEYLVAKRVLDELVDVAEATFAGRRGPREPEDDLLFALLSHQPLAVRQSTLTFAIELFSSHSDAERHHVLQVLEILIESYRSRQGSSRYISYRPTAVDLVRQLAAYSANLVTLRAALEPGDGMVPLAQMFRNDEDVVRQWRLTIDLWRSGLDADALQAMLATLIYSGNSIKSNLNTRAMSLPVEVSDLWYARLVGDTQLEDRLCFGLTISDGFLYNLSLDSRNWEKMVTTWLMLSVAGLTDDYMTHRPLPSGLSNESAFGVAYLIMELLKTRSHDLAFDEELLRTLFELPQVFEFDTRALAAVTIRHPSLVETFSELQDPMIFGEDWKIINVMLNVDSIWDVTPAVRKEFGRPYKPAKMPEAVYILLRAYLPEKRRRGP